MRRDTNNFASEHTGAVRVSTQHIQRVWIHPTEPATADRAGAYILRQDAATSTAFVTLQHQLRNTYSSIRMIASSTRFAMRCGEDTPSACEFFLESRESSPVWVAATRTATYCILRRDLAAYHACGCFFNFRTHPSTRSMERGVLRYKSPPSKAVPIAFPCSQACPERASTLRYLASSPRITGCLQAR